MSDEIEQLLRRLSNPTVNVYLDLMQNTETPALMHVWSLVSAAAACLTRRKWFQMGPNRIYPNQFIMLVGPPGTRKSTGVGYARALVSDIEGIRFGPNNTAGRSQGLVSAMQGRKSQTEDEQDSAFAEAMNSAGSSLDLGFGAIDLTDTHVLNRHALYCPESELVGFLGRNMDEFITFLGEMWDCPEKHTVTLKRETASVDFPCLNIVGGITPLHITTYLPPQSIGQGFTSRIILVYEDETKRIAWPEPIDERVLGQFKQLMLWIFNLETGAFEYDADVRPKVEELYNYKVAIDDIRFQHYDMRRQTHMMKTAMALAVLRQSEVVSAGDVQDAHDLLKITEMRMVEALGEYGMTETAVARARVQQVLKDSRQPLSALRIALSCGADVKRQEVQRAIMEMEQSSQIIQVNLRDVQGHETVGYVWPRTDNPFKRYAKVEVDYLLVNEGPTTVTKPKTSNDKLAEKLRPKQSGMDPELLSQYAEQVQATKAAAKPDDAGTLADQGFGSIMDKLKSFTTRSKPH